jgi:ubiquinol-cytochrome c reductase iron-sulfur subunit
MSREIVATPRMELAVLLALLVGAAAAIAFVVLYVVHPDTQLLGLCAGVVCVAFALAAVIAGKRLVPQERAVTEYHWFGDDEAAEDVEAIVAESGDGISRRRLLLGAAGAAGTAAAAAAAVPLASLGPDLGDRLAATAWRAGRAVVKEDGSPVRADEVQEGAFLLGLPEGSDPRHQLADAINLLRIPLDQLDLPADRKARCPGGVVAYSRICTHAGCAVSMYRVPLFAPHEPSPALICPCHYSTFDPRRGCAVDFGPAPRPLPQLPLRVNVRGELEAAGGFYEPPGPGYSLVRLQKGHDA